MSQQVVRLLGDLGERYGAEHVYQNLRTPADAIKLLCINYPAFQSELATAHQKGIRYRVLQAGIDLDLQGLHLPIGQNDLIVTPVLIGASDVGRVLLGAALIGASFIPGLQGVTFLGTSLAGVAGTVGASLALTGVTQMLSPQPDLGLGGASTRGDFQATRAQSVNRGFDGVQSYAYLGAQNTVGVGATIPVAYGKVLIGSHVISADVDVADESDPLKRATRTPGPDTVTVNGYKLELGRRTAEIESGRWNSLHFQNDRSNHLDDRFNSSGVSPDGDPVSILTKGSLRVCTNDFQLEFSEGPTKDPNTYFVFLEVNKLFEFVAGPGTTKTEAYISYVIESRERGTENIHARDSFTIQGLIMGTYRWYHKFDPNKVPNIDHYNLDVRIIDVSADSSVEFVIRHGFNPSFA